MSELSNKFSENYYERRRRQRLEEAKLLIEESEKRDAIKRAEVRAGTEGSKPYVTRVYSNGMTYWHMDLQGIMSTTSTASTSIDTLADYLGVDPKPAGARTPGVNLETFADYLNKELSDDQVNPIDEAPKPNNKKKDKEEENGMIRYDGQTYKKSDCIEIATGMSSKQYVPKELVAEDMITGKVFFKRDMCLYIVGPSINGKFPHKFARTSKLPGAVSIKYVESFTTDMVSEWMHGGGAYFLNKEILDESGYIEDVARCSFYHKSAIRRSQPKVLPDYEKFGYPDSTFRELTKKEKIDLGMESPTFIKTEGKKYTMGIEIETCAGRVPSWARHNLNMNCVYDGSLKGEDGIAHGKLN